MSFIQWYQSHDIPVKRIVGVAILSIFVLGLILTSATTNVSNDDVTREDKNVYLNEPIQYASDVFITVTGINVQKHIDESDQEVYNLNLQVSVRTEHKKHHWLSAELSSKNFELKSVNLKSKSKMTVFFEALVKETLNAAIDIVADGGINIIDETLNYIENYVEGSIENAENRNDFKAIKTTSVIEKFNPCSSNEEVELKLCFPILKDYLESDNVIVLAIDSASHFEKHIFLTLRPNN